VITDGSARGVGVHFPFVFFPYSLDHHVRFATRPRHLNYLHTT
jgi:hypothetical protein